MRHTGLVTAMLLFLGVITMSHKLNAQNAAPASSPATTSSPATASAPATVPPAPKIVSELINQRVRFRPFCFAGNQFPACDFETPALAKQYLGAYTIKVAFYDASGKAVTSADKPGRYAAVVEIDRENGRNSRRFVTLCRLSGEALPDSPAATQPAALVAAGLDEKLLADHAKEIAQLSDRRRNPLAAREAFMAIVAAGLYDLAGAKADGKDVTVDSLLRLDRQWWVNFKRTFYGLDKVYAKPFVCPQPLEGKGATVVHEGSLADAGMKSDAIEKIDAACEAWVKDVNTGFSLTVLRHGVVVLNKAYGSTARPADSEAPFTPDTVGPLASTTKFFTGIMLAEFADQGLIGMDDPAEKYLPALRGIKVAKPLIIRDMLVHTAGFDGHFGDLNPDLEEVVADFYPDLEVGKLHRYEGVGLAMTGKMMELVSGETMPRLFHRCLFDPLGCKSIDSEMTSAGAVATAMDLAKIGQMMLNGGAYGNLRFISPQTIQKMMPMAGQDRFAPDMTVRWGIGIKQFDSDGLSEKAFGHPGASGSCLVIDPEKDLVVSMIRFDEGGSFKSFLQKKARMYKAILDSMK